MKLNFTMDEIRGIEINGSYIRARKLLEDCLTLHSEVAKQTVLIEQLEETLKKALRVLETEFPGRFEYIDTALSAVEEWRKEQG